MWRPVWVAALLVVGSTRLAPAQEPGTHSVSDSIRVHPNTGDCIQQPILASYVETWLGTSTLSVPLRVDVYLPTGDQPLTLHIQRGSDEPAIKTFNVLPAECASRLRAVSLAIALVVDHTVLDRQPPEKPPEKPPEQPAEKPPEKPPEMPPATAAGLSPPLVRRARAPVRWALLGGGAVLAGTLPQASLAAIVGGQVEPTRLLRLRLTGLVTTEPSATLDEGRVGTRLWAGRMDGCLDRRDRSVAWSGCAGVAVGALRARGMEFSTNRAVWRPWAAALVRAQGQLALTSRLALEVGVDTLLTVSRPRLQVAGVEGDEIASYALPVLGVMASLGVVYNLP